MNLLKNVTRLMMLGLLAFNFACETNDELLPDELDPDKEYAAELTLVEGEGDVTETVFVSDLGTGATQFEVLLTMTSTDVKMKRIYMTQNLVGAGAEPYELELEGLSKKGDGSLELDSDQGNEVIYEIPFPVQSGLTAGTVEYQVWATGGLTARGDYRDSEKNLAVGVGTIVVNYGGSNPATDVKEYEATILAAPLADGSSSTFISLLDGEVYKINQGEEYVAFWDFGYYYGATGLASLASTDDYPVSVIDIATIANTTDDLNKVYFAASDLNFDEITKSAELNIITPSESQRINQLTVGDIIEFVDNYGKKGLIRVAALTPGNGVDGKITIEIKVQP
ncbi:hypothetical protein N6H18_05125 [Reichenbachiella agarivorans]|uniref:DUF1735 domain-containing protein n=1 Tax=Reichenbachiella agarivorans TaxID=2979464 RepID=A0ABY6CS49_9BACT|nr:hypothetical protein [Reichenbachiella agarivorans]UXP33332.1 hypothetical protein N6H18_05125 [Reichenbachiella agarivorans]